MFDKDGRVVIDRRNRYCRLRFEHDFQQGERKFLVAKSATIAGEPESVLDKIELFKSTKLIVPEPGEPEEWLIGGIKREIEPEAEPLRPKGPDMTAVFFREGGHGGGVLWPAFLPKKFSFFVDGIALLKDE